MMKWSFVVEIDSDEINNWNEVRDLVERKAEETVKTLKVPESGKGTYKLIVTSYQAKRRWLGNDPSIPRQDWGLDLDNLLKPIFDGLGPIIGYRIDWQGNKERKGVLDSSIVEVIAKKVNSGSDREFLGIELELLHFSEEAVN